MLQVDSELLCLGQHCALPAETEDELGCSTYAPDVLWNAWVKPVISENKCKQCNNNPPRNTSEANTVKQSPFNKTPEQTTRSCSAALLGEGMASPLGSPRRTHCKGKLLFGYHSLTTTEWQPAETTPVQPRHCASRYTPQQSISRNTEFRHFSATEPKCSEHSLLWGNDHQM